MISSHEEGLKEGIKVERQRHRDKKIKEILPIKVSFIP